MEQLDLIESRLWEYIDGTCTEAERSSIAAAIAANVAWKEKYDALMEFNSSLSATLETEQPSLRFSKNVMEAVAATYIAPATSKYINPAVIKGIAAVFIISICIIGGFAFSSINWSTSAKVALPKMNFDSVHPERWFTGNTVLIALSINTIVGLLFFDMMLRKRNKRERNQVL